MSLNELHTISAGCGRLRGAGGGSLGSGQADSDGAVGNVMALHLPQRSVPVLLIPKPDKPVPL